MKLNKNIMGLLLLVSTIVNSYGMSSDRIDPREIWLMPDGITQVDPKILATLSLRDTMLLGLTRGSGSRTGDSAVNALTEAGIAGYGELPSTRFPDSWYIGDNVLPRPNANFQRADGSVVEAKLNFDGQYWEVKLPENGEYATSSISQDKITGDFYIPHFRSGATVRELVTLID